MMFVMVLSACVDNPHQADLDRYGVKPTTGWPILSVLPCTLQVVRHFILSDSPKVGKVWSDTLFISIDFDYTLIVHKPMYFTNPLTRQLELRGFLVEIGNIHGTVRNIEDAEMEVIEIEIIEIEGE